MQAAPSVTRDVAVANPPSREIESGRGLAKTLSPTQTESKRGSASARRARSMSCAEVVTPKKTPRCGRVRPRPRSAAKRDLPISSVVGRYDGCGFGRCRPAPSSDDADAIAHDGLAIGGNRRVRQEQVQPEVRVEPPAGLGVVAEVKTERAVAKTPVGRHPRGGGRGEQAIGPEHDLAQAVPVAPESIPG